MAFAVTAYKSYSLPAYEAVTNQFQQVVEMTITRLATDVALDLGNVGGTFWTAAGAAGVGVAALANFKTVVQKARAIVNVTSPEIENTFTRVVAAPATTQYRLAAASPSGLAVTLFSGDALPTLKVFLVVSLTPGELPAAAVSL